MNAKALIIGVCAALALPVAARTALDLFKEPGASVAFGELEPSTRLDMADYYLSGLDRPSANRLGGTAVIDTVTDLTVRVQPAAMTQVDVCLLPGQDSVIMVIETTRLPQADSRLAFYSTDWKPLRKKPLDKLVLTDWLTEQGRTDIRQVQDWLPFMVARAQYNPETATLTVMNTLDQFYPAPEDRDRIRRWIKPQLVYHWTGKTFRQL